MVEFNGNVFLISGTPFFASSLILAKEVFVNLLVMQGRIIEGEGGVWGGMQVWCLHVYNGNCFPRWDPVPMCLLLRNKYSTFYFGLLFTLLCTSLRVRVHGLESSENWPVHYQLKPEITELLLRFKVASLRSDFANAVLNSSIFWWKLQDWKHYVN